MQDKLKQKELKDGKRFERRRHAADALFNKPLFLAQLTNWL
jgi:hypothetical protein